MGVVQVRDGQRIPVRRVGRGSPVLVLGGLGMASRHWLPLVASSAHRFRFYIPDLRGEGRSARVPFNRTDAIQNHMEDVADIAAHFRLRDFSLVGYSMGATTALHWQRAGGFAGVRRYLHVDQSACIPNRRGWSYGLMGPRQGELFAILRPLKDLLDAHPGATRLQELPLDARAAAVMALSRVFALGIGSPALVPVLQAAARWPRYLTHLLPPVDLQRIRVYLGTYLAGRDYRRGLKDCPTPTTLFVGMRSPLYDPRGQIALADYFPDCRVVRFEKSGHIPMLNEPGKFIRELNGFLRRG